MASSLDRESGQPTLLANRAGRPAWIRRARPRSGSSSSSRGSGCRRQTAVTDGPLICGRGHGPQVLLAPRLPCRAGSPPTAARVANGVKAARHRVLIIHGVGSAGSQPHSCIPAPPDVRPVEPVGVIPYAAGEPDEAMFARGSPATGTPTRRTGGAPGPRRGGGGGGRAVPARVCAGLPASGAGGGGEPRFPGTSPQARTLPRNPNFTGGQLNSAACMLGSNRLIGRACAPASPISSVAAGRDPHL